MRVRLKSHKHGEHVDIQLHTKLVIAYCWITVTGFLHKTQALHDNWLRVHC